MTQNNYFNASINVLEVDGEDLFFTTNITHPNFKLDTSNGNITYLPSNDDVGIIYANISVFDENYTKDVVNISLIVNNHNDRPETLIIISPSNDTEFTVLDFIKFNGTCDDKDLHIIGTKEKLSFIWWSNKEGKIGEGSNLNDILLVEGEHEITLEVKDAEGLTNTASIIIHVNKNEAGTIIEPPFCTLTSPNDEEIINNLSITLEWETNFTKPDMITYNVFLDSDANPTTLIAEKITDTKLFINNLEDKKSYYWQVIPYLGPIKGNCTSGTRHFNVDIDYIPEDDDSNKSVSTNMFFLIISVILIVVIIIFAVILIKKKKKNRGINKISTISPEKSLHWNNNNQFQQISQQQQLAKQIHQPNYVQQNNRYYCYHCQKYV